MRQGRAARRAARAMERLAHQGGRTVAAFALVAFLAAIGLGVALAEAMNGTHCRDGDATCHDLNAAARVASATGLALATASFALLSAAAASLAASHRRRRVVSQRATARLSTVKKAFADGGFPESDFDAYLADAEQLERGTHPILRKRTVFGLMVAVGAASILGACIVGLGATVTMYGCSGSYCGGLGWTTVTVSTPIMLGAIVVLAAFVIAGLGGGIPMRSQAIRDLSGALDGLDRGEARLLRLAHARAVAGPAKPAARPRGRRSAPSK